ncbi:hypothetical protein J6590_077239 [Homalodisca vitripennis]|nr:hypothetical protein J6590_077239 [Homalodisca vitripennis]
MDYRPGTIGFTGTRSPSHSALVLDVYYPFCCQSSTKSRVSVLQEPPICPQVLTAAAAHAHRYLGREKVVRMVKRKAQIESRVNLRGLNTNARYHHSPGSKYGMRRIMDNSNLETKALGKSVAKELRFRSHFSSGEKRKRCSDYSSAGRKVPLGFL